MLPAFLTDRLSSQTWVLYTLCLSCLLIISGSLSPAYGFKSREQLAVFDSKDVKVGKVLGLINGQANPLWVALNIEGHLVALRVSRSQLKGPDGVETYYLSHDCSGEPHFQHSQVQKGAGMLPAVLIAPPGQTVYVADKEGLSLVFYPQSLRKASGSCEKLNLINPIKLRPGKALINLQEVFTAPFHIR